MNLKLVKFIETKPSIWNPRHPKYTSIAHRDRIYAEFASKYGNQFTGQAVKARWTNIRCTFANYLRKSRLGEMSKVLWPLWDACSFLKNVNQLKKMPRLPENVEETKEDVDVDGETMSTDEEDISNRSPIEVDPTCQNIANGILNVFRGVQNNVFDEDYSKYSKVGQTICTRLSQMSSLEASRISNKIMDVLWLYHEDNPMNPNNLKAEPK